MPDNIILITIDSLRADFVDGSNEGDQSKSPFIDSLADDGIRFTNAYANGPRTSASFQAILASRYPLEFGRSTILSNNHTSIAEIFEKSGYHTAGFHSNPYLSTEYGYDRGFDVFDDGEECVGRVTRLSRIVRNYLDYGSWTYDKLRKIKKYSRVPLIAVISRKRLL